MRKTDIQKLSKLLALKQQAASSKYKQRLTEQQRLLDEATRCLNESHNLHMTGDEAPTAADLITANRYRKSLREKSVLLTAAAHSLDEMIADLRANTREALTREAAMERLVAELEKKIRSETNNRDENAREQIVLNGR